MKKILAAGLISLFFITPAAAMVWTTTVCDGKTLAPSATTDCTVVDLARANYVSYQFRCNSASTTISVHLDWIAGSGENAAAYLAVPIHSNGSAQAQLRTSYTTESTTVFSALQAIEPPIAPYGTLRFTNTASTADVICTAILNLGD